MPIRFHCSNCQQRLSVATRKAGQDVKCPTCRRVTRVPATAEGTSEVGSEGDVPGPIASFPGLVEDRELVYADVPAADMNGSEPPQRGSPYVSIPRYVIYTQGFLLGAVALVFFVFGLNVGSRSGGQSSNPLAQSSCVVSGDVLYVDSTGTAVPDVGAVVVLLPTTRRPDEKVSADGLQPAAAEVPEDNRGLLLLRSLGGDYARVDRRGHYQVRSETTGRYYLLIISRHSDRRELEHPRASELAQLGRYFIPATELLGQHRYRWQEIVLRDDQQINATFDHQAD